MTNPDVLVIGAGITGAAAALELAQSGASVEIVDTYGPAAMASGWTLAGVRQSGRHPAEMPLAQAAVAGWPTLAERLGGETHYRQEGNLRLACTEAEIAHIKGLVDSHRAQGLDLDFLPTLEDVRTITPALSDRVMAASFCPTDGHADPNATVASFIAAGARHGVRLSTGEAVERFETQGGKIVAALTATRRITPGAVVLAGGVQVNRLLEPLGAAIPFRITIVTVIRSTPTAPILKPVLGTAGAVFAARQEWNGRLRFTSGSEPFVGTLTERDGRPFAAPNIRRLRDTIDRVGAVLPPVLDCEIEAVWGGLLDLTPDALPVIDRAPGLDNLVVAAGFSGHGFCIGPVTGPLAADLALGRPPRLSLEAFRFARFNALDGPAAPLTLHG
ncbi:NAD(P)/FAD-dependent oxidoreductase [Acuticoccus kandeliae]|uniref:NAD(P)/FAD-dependent oxidoreductase n=1 Tax=Acuticoccus kandeliae TaxID=2073160 RepID=UPI000D3EC2F5|nr:FAD-binding oxidoreductase [Acuticoccus kandeliae]